MARDYRGEGTLQQGENPKLKQRDRDKCNAGKLASKRMEPDGGWWASAAATPDLRAVTVGRRTRRTSGRLNGWPVRYVQQRLNVSYRRTSATTNDWTSDDDWDDRTSGETEWPSTVGRLNLTRLNVRRRSSNRGRIRPLNVGWMNLRRDNVSSRTS